MTESNSQSDKCSSYLHCVWISLAVLRKKNRCNLRLRSSDEIPGELQPLADTERHQLFRGGGAELLRVLRSQAEPNINTIQL